MIVLGCDLNGEKKRFYLRQRATTTPPTDYMNYSFPLKLNETEFTQ